MASTDLYRQQLSEFLKSCRARLTPGELGLPENTPRRLSGLRREEVALKTGVSATWYTWLEQGRDIRVSEDLLERISTVLRLSADERDFLFMLVQRRPAPLKPIDNPEAQITTCRMVESLSIPALVGNERWDIITMNRLASLLIADEERLEASRRNMMRLLLRDESEQFENYTQMMNGVIAKFRMDYGQSADPDSFTDLIESLKAEFPLFAELWTTASISKRSGTTTSTVSYANYGDIALEASTYVPDAHPALRVTIFVPADSDSAESLACIAQSL